MTLNTEEAFKQFDKQSKGFLTKHEFKCAIFYKTGVKLRYDLLKCLWNEKEKYYSEKNIQSQGINIRYFKHILKKHKEIYPTEDQRLEFEFQSIDSSRRGRINFKQFNELIESYKGIFINEKIRESIFSHLDLDRDGFIGIQDYKLLMVSHDI